MIDLKDINEVKALQRNLKIVFGSPQGGEIMKYLEQICGWYNFYDTNQELVLTMNGRRQVLANIKTLLEQPPDVIVRMAKMLEG